MLMTAAAQFAAREMSLWLEPDALAGNCVDAVRRVLALSFRNRGLDSPDLDARLIIGHALGLDHTALAAQAKRRLLAGEAVAITSLANRRLRREPIARILGAKEFWGLSFRIDAHTFVPRPETETVVEAALEAIGERGHCSRGLRIGDLGTGAGTLVLSLLAELREASGVGTDISAAAIDCARYNAAAQGARAAFVACHYGAALDGPINLLVSNPPYIPRAEIAGLEPEVRAFDPQVALDGGPDGTRWISGHSHGGTSPACAGRHPRRGTRCGASGRSPIALFCRRACIHDPSTRSFRHPASLGRTAAGMNGVQPR